MSDLRQSGSIEQDADRVIFVYREEYYFWNEGNPTEKQQARFDQVRGLAELIVDKDRHGRGGPVTVAWNASRMMFSDLAR